MRSRIHFWLRTIVQYSALASARYWVHFVKFTLKSTCYLFLFDCTAVCNVLYDQIFYRRTRPFYSKYKCLVTAWVFCKLHLIYWRVWNNFSACGIAVLHATEHIWKLYPMCTDVLSSHFSQLTIHGVHQCLRNLVYNDVLGICLKGMCYLQPQSLKLLMKGPLITVWRGFSPCFFTFH